MANRLFKQFFYSFTSNLVGLHGSASLVQPVLSAVTAQGVTYTAKALGKDGDDIEITLVDGATAGAEVVTVAGKSITVQIEDGVTTQTQLKAAIDGNANAAALVSVAVASGATAVDEAAAVTTSGGVDGVSAFDMKGVQSIKHTGTGEYTVVLEDKYVALESIQLQLQAASAADLVPQMISEDVDGTKEIKFRLNAGATPTNPSAAAKVYLALRLRNSSVI